MKVIFSILAIFTLLAAGSAFGKTVMVYKHGMFQYVTVESAPQEAVQATRYVYRIGMFVYEPVQVRPASGKPAKMVYDRGLFKVVDDNLAH